MKKLYFTLLVISLFLSLSSFAIVYLFFKPLYVNTLEANVTIVNGKGGFDLRSDVLTFGIISNGGSSTRQVSLSNTYDFPVYAKVSSEGSISDLLSYDSMTRIEPHTTEKISVSVVSSGEDEEGDYTGTVTFKIIPAR